MRSNLVIAIGDLAFRFPNLLEPWTANMYEPLLDPDNGECLTAATPCRVASAHRLAVLQLLDGVRTTCFTQAGGTHAMQSDL